jgi:hypothetical protein
MKTFIVKTETLEFCREDWICHSTCMMCVLVQRMEFRIPGRLRCRTSGIASLPQHPKLSLKIIAHNRLPLCLISRLKWSFESHLQLFCEITFLDLTTSHADIRRERWYHSLPLEDPSSSLMSDEMEERNRWRGEKIYDDH